MGRDLTKRYSALLEKKGLKNPLLLVRDIYEYRKFSEVGSFIVWELLHRLRLYPKKKYLSLNSEPLTLKTQRLDDPEFTSTIEDQFKSRGLSIARVDRDWKVLFIKDDKQLLGCLYPDDTDLYKSVDGGESLVLLERFPERIKSIFVSSQDTVFVCVKGAVYLQKCGRREVVREVVRPGLFRELLQAQ
jgi:hypothetical protein